MSLKSKQKAIIPTKDIFDLVHCEGETVERKVSETIYYEEKYAKFKDKSIFISWNWAAFFFGMAWLWYRKMYAYFFVLAFVLFFTELIIKYRSPLSEFEEFVGEAIVLFVVNILICGIFGNSIYFRFLRTKYMNHVRHLGTNHWLVTFLVMLAIGYSLESLLNRIVILFQVLP